LIHGENNLGDKSLRTESIISSVHIGNKSDEWENGSDFDKITL